MTIDRRSLIVGMAGGLAMGGLSLGEPAWGAAPGDLLFAGTPFADNRVARSFRRVDLPLPDIAVLTRTGRQRLPQLAGTPRLLTLWAEWCVPCLIEARDLAALQRQVHGPGLEIVSALTGSFQKLDYAGAVERLAKVGATDLTLVVEPDGGHAIVEALSVRPPAERMAPPPNLPPGARIVNRGTPFTLPCTLLVDRRGRVRGRATGIAMVMPPAAAGQAGKPLDAAQKQAMLGQETKTAWTSADGATFLRALHGGLLDRV